jgi:hypothetical protein
MDAMQRSNLVLAKVLDLAMTNGISHWSPSFKDLGLSEEYETHFFPCVDWLLSEGLIRAGAYDRFMGGLAAGNVRNIALTSRGMAVLGQKIAIDGREEEFAETVTKVSEGKVDYHRIGDAMGGLIGGIIKSFAN